MSVGLEDRPIDLVHLARYTGGDMTLNSEVLRLFQTQADEILEQLREALPTADVKAWHALNHSLKGAARGIGAFNLADATAEAEAVDPMDREKAAAALSAVQTRADNVRIFISAYLRH
jgi:HPt (histidine-containing phosphotransfer) domain-containing protein